MLLSYTIPCHKREADLFVVFPELLEAAAQSPPVEIVVVDYANPEPLAERLLSLPVRDGVTRRVALVPGSHYRMAHARNVGIQAASGDYVVSTCADIFPHPGYWPSYFAHLRERIAASGADVLIPTPKYRGVICVKRDLFLRVGGYDERMEFYGPEDKDLVARLQRAIPAEKISTYESASMAILRTPNERKIANYRLPLSKREMHEHGMATFRENDAVGRVTANEGQTWGAW